MDQLKWPGLELRGHEASHDHLLESQNIHQTSVETSAPNLYGWERIAGIVRATFPTECCNSFVQQRHSAEEFSERSSRG
ncbi:hypothetical protein Tco_0996439 [Tanacetum coccineum]